MPMTQPRTTLATVAASAGVSVATVSKVLNGRRDVAPATRARVHEMLRAHDYGGRLKTIERHPTIELTLRGRIGSYSAEIVQGRAQPSQPLITEGYHAQQHHRLYCEQCDEARQ